MMAASLEAATCVTLPSQKRAALAREGLQAAEWALGAHLRSGEALPEDAVEGLGQWSRLCARYDAALHSLIAGPDACADGDAGAGACAGGASASAGMALLEAVRAAQLRFRIEARLASDDAGIAPGAGRTALEAAADAASSATAADAAAGPDGGFAEADSGRPEAAALVEDGVLPSVEDAARLAEEDPLKPLRRARKAIRHSPQQLLAARTPSLLGLASASVRVTRVRIPGWGSAPPARRGKPARRRGGSAAVSSASGAE